MISAGPFGAWLEQFERSLLSDEGADVPCGDCVGCCVSSYHIPIRPTDSALTKIPADRLISAPGQAPGHRMLPYEANGECPMLSDRQCTIYSHRPQTCRDYDCRVFAAAGIVAGGADKHVINERVAAWRFTYESESMSAIHDAIKAAARFIAAHKSQFPFERAPTAPTGIAVLAVKSYSVFLDACVNDRDPKDIARAIVASSREFDSKPQADRSEP